MMKKIFTLMLAAFTATAIWAQEEERKEPLKPLHGLGYMLEA
jgi:hypothetical protein